MIDYKIKGTPKPYQAQFSDYALEHKYVLNGSKPGTGKSLMALSPCFRNGNRTLIVCPAYLTENWVQEVAKWQTEENFPVILKNAKQFPLAKNYQICITSYGMVKYLQGTFGNIVLDECHLIKNKDSKRTMGLTKFLINSRPELFLPLSGTPVLNNMTEWFVPLKLLSSDPSNSNGRKLRMGFEEFADTFSQVHKFKTRVYSKRFQKKIEVEVVKYSGQKNMRLLDEYLKHKYFCVTEKEANIPPVIYKDIYFDQRTPKELEGLDNYFKSDGVIDLSLATKKKLNATLKAPFSAQFAHDLLQAEGGHIVIFSDHVDSCQIIKEELNKKGIKEVAIIDGDVKPEIRHKLVDSLQRGLIKILICTIGSASTGFTMTTANRVIFNDFSWSYWINEQARKRLHRIGQLQSVYVYFINASPVDRKINTVIKQKFKDVGGF